MNINEMINNMPKKRLTLLKNLVSVSVIFVIAFSALSIAETKDPLAFLKTKAFINVAIALVGLSFAWKILNGGTIKVPSGQKQTNTTHSVSKKRQSPDRSGTWVCPQCGMNVIPTLRTCPKCGSHE